MELELGQQRAEALEELLNRSAVENLSLPRSQQSVSNSKPQLGATQQTIS